MNRLSQQDVERIKGYLSDNISPHELALMLRKAGYDLAIYAILDDDLDARAAEEMAQKIYNIYDLAETLDPQEE